MLRGLDYLKIIFTFLYYGSATDLLYVLGISYTWFLWMHITVISFVYASVYVEVIHFLKSQNKQCMLAILSIVNIIVIVFVKSERALLKKYEQLESTGVKLFEKKINCDNGYGFTDQ